MEVTDPALSPSSNAIAPTSPLTTRENEVLRLLGEGLAKKIVASKLNVSQHTVKLHVNFIMGKLNAQHRTQSVTVATRLELLPI